ncbi:MAG: hypothetical protein D6753_01805 [Planctomycetota bacterium]|nr:MAG: hypothetical protein D6753_01805 [Planctomycetota bacterium]
MTKSMLHVLAWAWLLTCAAESTAQGERPAVVKRALTDHMEAVGQAKAELMEAILGEIKRSATLEQADRLPELVEALERLRNSDLPPNLENLADSVQKYIAARKASALKVHAAYQEAIAEATKATQLQVVQFLAKDMAEFIEQERVAMGLATREPSAKSGDADADSDPLDDAAGDPDDGNAPKSPIEILSERTTELVRETLTEVAEAVEEARKLDTSAKILAKHLEDLERIAKKLGNKKVMLHFPVVDVQYAPGATAVLQLGMPDELLPLSVDKSWWLSSSATEAIRVGGTIRVHC